VLRPIGQNRVSKLIQFHQVWQDDADQVCTLSLYIEIEIRVEAHGKPIDALKLFAAPMDVTSNVQVDQHFKNYHTFKCRETVYTVSEKT
jgi:hypothetical protein